ncbi:MAG: sugar ABC transporter ATP-binding protein [Candidatus Velthaea sp.]
MPAIEGIALSKSFGGVKALRSASFAADGGEVHALVGENGAGKSTLIKLLSGLYPPDSGEIRVDDAAVTFARPQAALASGIGTVFQELTLLPYMTVAENVMLGREPLRGPFIQRNKVAERARELFVAAGIGADAGIEPLELVGNLSLARQQIVEIVKTVSRRPRIVFMDEPTSALAEHSVAWLFGLIKQLRSEGVCIVFTSHRWNEIKGIADRITVFRNGERVATSNAVDLSEGEAVERMTGQRLEVLFPKPTPVRSEVDALAVDGLSAKGVPAISFQARAGEVLGIGGLAGQGQRELFLTLFGVTPRAGGTVRVGGRETKIRTPHDAIRAGIALIPEDRKTEGLLLPLSVRQNLALAVLGRLSRGGFVRRTAEDELVDSMVTSLAIKTPTPGQRVGALSGGNQQKVLIGRWLLTDARVLLLYDITRGVDVATKRDIYGLIRRLSEEGRTILFYSTDTEEIAHLCHRVLIMREGRIVSELRDSLTPEAIVAAAIRVPVAL